MSTKRQNGKAEKAGTPTAGIEDRAGTIARLAYQKCEVRGSPAG